MDILWIHQPNICRPGMRENLTLMYANNKGADQPVHQPSLINTFVIGFLVSIMTSTLVKSAYQNIIFLFLNLNICCGYSKEPSQ